MIKPVVTPKEIIKRNEDSFMLLNPAMKISTNTSFIKSSSLSPKKNKSHLQKIQSPMFLQDTQEFPVGYPEKEIDMRGFTRGGIFTNKFLKNNQFKDITSKTTIIPNERRTFHNNHFNFIEQNEFNDTKNRLF